MWNPTFSPIIATEEQWKNRHQWAHQGRTRAGLKDEPGAIRKQTVNVELTESGCPVTYTSLKRAINTAKPWTIEFSAKKTKPTRKGGKGLRYRFQKKDERGRSKWEVCQRDPVCAFLATRFVEFFNNGPRRSAHNWKEKGKGRLKFETKLHPITTN
jgi:hypothetical protein